MEPKGRCCEHRILYILNSPDTAGGVMTGVLQLVKALPREKYKSYLVVPQQPNAEQYNRLTSLFDKIAVVPMSGGWTKDASSPWHRRMPSEVLAAARTFFHLRPVCQLVRLIHSWKIDVAYTGSALVVDAAIAARLAGIPHIWHIREWIGKQGNTSFYLADRLLVRLIAFLSTQIIVMSDFVGEIFVRYGKRDKILKIYDGVNPRDFKPNVDGKPLRNRLGVRDDELLIGLIAAIGPSWKKHEVFIKMAAILRERLPNVRFVHFGHVPLVAKRSWQRYNALCRMIEDSGLADRFIWGGVVCNTPEMMAALDLLVHPSDVEPFGRIAIEAMAAGLPVVGAAGGGIAESIEDGQTGLLVLPDEPNAFSEAALKLLKDGNLRHRMGKAGVARVQRYFSIENHVNQMVKVFEAASQ